MRPRSPLRGEGIAFTAPYVLIEGAYLVPADSPIQANEEADQAAHRVAVGKGSAYDLHLTRELRHARIVRAPTSPAVVETTASRSSASMKKMADWRSWKPCPRWGGSPGFLPWPLTDGFCLSSMKRATAS